MVALRIHGVLLILTADPVAPAHLVIHLCQHMARIRPVPAARHSFPTTFVHRDLHKCTRLFLRKAQRAGLWSPLQRPLSRKEKTLQLLVRGRPITVSTDTVKPAYILNGTDHWNRTFNPAVDATLTIAPPVTPPPPTARTTSSVRHALFSARFSN
jgi:hypothetical protein